MLILMDVSMKLHDCKELARAMHIITCKTASARAFEYLTSVVLICECTACPV